MEKEEIIEKVYEKGKKWQGVLMACYSKEFFTRDYIEDLVIDHHASLTAVNSTIDRLLEDEYIIQVGTHKTKMRYIYTISVDGEKKLYDLFPALTYRMACMLDNPSIMDDYIFKENEKDDMNRELNEENSLCEIEEECDRIKDVLLDKNERYGNSSLNPSGIFTSVRRESKIEARIDDKLSRIKNYAKKGDKHNKDYYDAIDDLIGYLILYRIALRGD